MESFSWPLMPRPLGAPSGTWAGRPRLSALRLGSGPPAVRHPSLESDRWYCSPDCTLRGGGSTIVRLLEPALPLSGFNSRVGVGPKQRIVVEDPAIVSGGALPDAEPDGPRAPLA